jgi:hypothetical protein
LREAAAFDHSLRVVSQTLSENNANQAPAANRRFSFYHNALDRATELRYTSYRNEDIFHGTGRKAHWNYSRYVTAMAVEGSDSAFDCYSDEWEDALALDRRGREAREVASWNV